MRTGPAPPGRRATTGARRGDELRAPAGLGEQDARSGDEVVRDAAAAVRDPRHRVREVAVEAGEEAEAVLRGQVRPPAGPRPRHRHRARLAAERVARLVHRDVESPLGQLVRGAQPADPSAQHRNRRHVPTLRTPRRVRPPHASPASSASRARPTSVFPFFADAGNLEAITPAVAALPRRHAAPDRDARGHADRVPAASCTALPDQLADADRRVGAGRALRRRADSTVRTRSGTTRTSSRPTATATR